MAAVTRILFLPQQPAGSNFLNRLGVSPTGRDLFNWTADFTQDTNGDVILPPNLSSSEGIGLYTTTVMPAIHASLTNLTRITDQGFMLTLTAAETSIDNCHK